MGALRTLLKKVSQKILNREKKLGNNFEVFDFGTSDNFPTEIENEIKNILEELYDLLFDYLPENTTATSCEETSEELEESEEETSEESSFENSEDDSIGSLINNFLYLHCNGKTLEDPVERGKYGIYLSVQPNVNKINLINDIYNQILQDEKEISQFCQKLN